MKCFEIILSSLFFLATTSISDQKREENAYKFCQDVWLSNKSDDQIIQQYLVKNTSKDVSDVDRSSLIEISLNNLREIKPSGPISGIKVKPYSQVTPIHGLASEINYKEIYAITDHDKVVFYALFENDRIASFIVVKKGQKSYFLKF